MKRLDEALARQPWLAGGEFLLGALIVIGHNVFRLVPNEVPILVALGLLSNRVWTGSWRLAGFERPSSWKRVLLIAVIAAALRIIVGTLVIEPITSRFWPPQIAPSGASDITANLPNAMLALGLVWTFAAFGEEFAYRGFLISRGAALGRGSTMAYWVAVIAVSILFGYGHYYKGPAGVLDSAVAGLILGAAFMLSGRNLWAPVLAHGLIDTIAVVELYFGWTS